MLYRGECEPEEELNPMHLGVYFRHVPLLVLEWKANCSLYSLHTALSRDSTVLPSTDI